MNAIRINGNNNISNTGVVQGDCVINNIEFSVIDIYRIFTMNENDKSLVNITEAQHKLSEAIEAFARTELVRAEEGRLRAEAEVIRARADENNSLANLNYSKIMLEDREIIKQMIEKLK